MIEYKKCSLSYCNRPAHNHGYGVLGTYCSRHHKIRAKLEKPLACDNVKGFLGFTCTSTIVHKCQIQIDHWDGDRNNNDPKNYVYLCANCHSYKTILFKDHLTRYTVTSKDGNDWRDIPRLHKSIQQKMQAEQKLFENLFEYNV